MGRPLDGTAAGGSDKDQGGTVALTPQAWGSAGIADPAGSGGETGWSQPAQDQAVLLWRKGRKE